MIKPKAEIVRICAKQAVSSGAGPYDTFIYEVKDGFSLKITKLSIINVSSPAFNAWAGFYVNGLMACFLDSPWYVNVISPSRLEGQILTGGDVLSFRLYYASGLSLNILLTGHLFASERC